MNLAFYSYLLSYTSKWEEKNICVLLFFCHEDIPWPRILIEARVFGGLEVWEGEYIYIVCGRHTKWLGSSSWENICLNNNHIAETEQTGWCGILELKLTPSNTHSPTRSDLHIFQEQFQQLLTSLQPNELCGPFSLKLPKLVKENLKYTIVLYCWVVRFGFHMMFYT